MRTRVSLGIKPNKLTKKDRILAPVMMTIAQRLGETHKDKVVEVWEECMSATRRVWVPGASGQPKDGHWEIEPDYKTQLSAANTVAAYVEGLPVQRQQIQMSGTIIVSHEEREARLLEADAVIDVEPLSEQIQHAAQAVPPVPPPTLIEPDDDEDY